MTRKDIEAAADIGETGMKVFDPDRYFSPRFLARPNRSLTGYSAVEMAATRNV
jgi:hypothetical protein